ncbi:MAG: lysylphosphatidylglycerol synthase domain-containing protein, partial [Saprospiraceae bacterium]
MPGFVSKWLSFLQHSAYRRRWALGFKVVVAILLLGGLYLELRNRNNLPALWAAFLQQLGGAQWWWLPLAILLMPLNWLTETLKWQPYAQRYQPLTVWQGFQGVLTGVSFTMFTPHQLGEYGGRLLFVQPEHRWKVVMINVVGSWAQYLVAVLAGLIGVLLFLGQSLALPPTMLRYGALLVLAGLPLLLVGYFHMERLLGWARQVPILRRLRPFVRDVHILQTFRQRDLWRVLGWAALRYIIFSSQYFFLLRFFGIPASLIAGYAGISTIFLVQT